VLFGDKKQCDEPIEQQDSKEVFHDSIVRCAEKYERLITAVEHAQDRERRALVLTFWCAYEGITRIKRPYDKSLTDLLPRELSVSRISQQLFGRRKGRRH